jgi:co-chaperonin GroES (HSP10)
MFMDTNPNRELRFAGATTTRRLRPTRGKLLVRIEPDAVDNDSLIVVPAEPEADRRRVRRGVVVARPADAGASASDVAEGDTVLFPAGCGHGLRLRINGRENVLVREQDILATVEDAARE